MGLAKVPYCSSGNPRRGTSLVSSLVALALLGISAAVVTQLSNLGNSSTGKNKEGNAIAQLRRRFTGVQLAPVSWLDDMRAKYPQVATCLPPSGSINCSTLSQVDSSISVIAAGRTVSSIPLIDIKGNQIAGTQSAPAYFDADGNLCTAPSSVCRIQSAGYMLRSSGGSGPDKVELVMKLSRAKKNGVNVASDVLNPVIERVSLGTLWQKKLNIPNQPVCPIGKMVDSIDSAGNFTCNRTVNATCNAGEYLISIDSMGNPKCDTYPVTPPSPDTSHRFLQVWCSSPSSGNTWTYCNVPGIGTSKITDVSVLYHWWRRHHYKGCDVGNEISFEGQQVKVKDKCTALLLVGVEG